MSKKCCKYNIGLLIACVGLGVVLTVLMPYWGWIIAVGAGIIYFGWWIMGHRW